MQRDAYWDMVKGLAVLLILAGHTGAPLVPFIYMYNLAVFFFVAGYFYREKYTAEPFRYMGTRLQRLWWPCVRWAVLFVLLHNVLLAAGLYAAVPGIPLAGEQHVYSLADMLRALVHAFTLQGLEDMAVALWFVEMMLADLFMLCGMHYLVRRLSGWRRELALLAGAGAVYGLGCYFIQHQIYPEYYFHTACLLFVPVYLGYLYQRFQCHVPLHWAGGLAAALVVLFVYRHTGTWIEYSQNRMIGPKWFVLANAGGLYFHLWLCRLLQRGAWFTKVLACVGRESLGIIALHFLAFKAAGVVYIKAMGLPTAYLAAIPVVGYPLQSGVWWVFFVLCGVCLPLLVLAGGRWCGRWMRARLGW